MHLSSPLCALAASLTLASAPLHAQSTSQPDSIDFVGFLAYSDAWTDDGKVDPRGGYYSFSANADSPFTPCTVYGRVEGSEVSATFHADEAFAVKTSGYWYKYSVSASHLNAYSWEQTSSVDLGSYEEGIAEDLTYNYADGKTYAVTYQKMANSNSGYLCTVDEQTGQFTRIASIPFMYTLAADAQGQLWSIGADGMLYTIDRATGATTKVGDTGFRPKEMQQSATFDLRTGKLYWAINGFEASDNLRLNIVCGILCVDTATGKASVVRTFPRYERFSSIFVRDAHPAAPDRLADFRVDAESGEGTGGTVRFTLPAHTYVQQALTGEVSYVVCVDGKQVASGSAAAGTEVSVPVELGEAGAHQVAARCSAGGHDAPWSRMEVYAGVDTPSTPANLQVVQGADQLSATLTWDPVTTGANGGYINPDDVTYTVWRMPANVRVGRATKQTKLVDTPNASLQNIRYVVTATYKGHESDRAFSAWVRAGKSWEMPYVEPFDTEQDFNACTTVDANGDGSDDWEAPSWKYDAAYAAAFYYNKSSYAQADDWLITPPLAFDPAKLYKLTFQTYGYYGYTNKLEVAVGAQPMAEAMGRPFFTKEYESTMTSVKTFSTYIAPTEGTRYVGFHNISSTGDHMSIDNILVAEAGSSLVPAAPTDVRAGGKVGHATLSFRMPTLNARGEQLSGTHEVRIYRGNETEPAATLKAEPGTIVNWVDEWAAAMLNTYRIAAANAEGEGIPAEASVDLSEKQALAPASVKAEALSDDAVRISWSASPTGGAVQYAVYRVYNYEATLLASHLDSLSFVDTHASAPLPEGTPQGAVSYRVQAFNSAGEGLAAQSETVKVGRAYTLPFAETWYQQATATNPWGLEGTGTASWIVEGYGYDPSTPGQDGAGMVKFTVNSVESSTLGGSTASYISPAIDFTSLHNPVARFYIYRAPSLSATLRVTVSLRDAQGQTISLPSATFSAQADEAGWSECVVPLTAGAALTRGNLVFTGAGSVTGQNLHLDNLTITGDAYALDARIAALEVPDTVVAGREHDVTVRVANNGSSTLQGVKVTLLADHDVLAEETLDEVAVGDTEELVMSYEPERSGLAVITAKVSAEGDEQPLNDLLSRTLVVNEPALAYIEGLQGEVNADRTEVTLRWDAPTATPTAQQCTDDFESYADFAISGIGGWTLHDGDHVRPFNFRDASGNIIEWPNNSVEQAFIVFNPSQTVLTGAILAHSGEKSLVSFGSPYAQNDDWLISPRLSGHEQLISFYARGIDSQAASEYFRVLYSTTDTLTTSFHPVSGTTPLKGGTEWKEYSFNLPEGSRYFAIQYMGIQESGLMVDDVCFNGYYAPQARPDAYVILRNGEEVATVGEPSFTDAFASSLAEDAVLKYQVQALYGSRLSQPSRPFYVAPTGIGTVESSAAARWTATPQHGAISLSGLCGHEAVVCAADGRIVARVQADGRVTLSAGVYVVTSQGRSVKVAVM